MNEIRQRERERERERLRGRERKFRNWDNCPNTEKKKNIEKNAARACLFSVKKKREKKQALRIQGHMQIISGRACLTFCTRLCRN